MIGGSDTSCWNYLEPVCPVFDVGSRLFWFVFTVVSVLIFIDVPYFLRIWSDAIMAKLHRQPIPPGVLTTHVYNGTVQTCSV